MSVLPSSLGTKSQLGSWVNRRKSWRRYQFRYRLLINLLDEGLELEGDLEVHLTLRDELNHFSIMINIHRYIKKKSRLG